MKIRMREVSQYCTAADSEPRRWDILLGNGVKMTMDKCVHSGMQFTYGKDPKGLNGKSLEDWLNESRKEAALAFKKIAEEHGLEPQHGRGLELPISVGAKMIDIEI